MHMYKHIHTNETICTGLRAHIHTCMYLSIYVHAHACDLTIHTCVRTHTYIHARMHVRERMRGVKVYSKSRQCIGHH